MLMEVQLSDLHEHPLVLSYDKKYIKSCHMCKKCVNSTSFYCAQCDFGLHYTCAVTLPQHINHPFHLHHPLTLISNEEYECHVCKKLYCYNRKRPKSYTCFECNFHIDIECALLPTIPCGKRIQPLCHLRPMSLIENYDEYDGGVLECYVCESPCPSGSPTSTFVCSICKRFIHYSCIEFPLMTHPFMPSSSPLLQVIRYGKSSCVSCHRNTHNFFILYKSQRQQRILCLPCTFLRPTIEYPGHNHLLCLIEKYNSISDQCNSYGSCCRHHVSSNDELNFTNKSFILSCAPCSFTLHLLCGPLPCTIKHNCHIHPLTLFDSIVEDNLGEYFCDACEMERDPRLCVYYCAECKFIAHVHCVISEVVRVLKGDLKDVELRVVGQRKFDRELVRPSVLELRDKIPIVWNAWKEKKRTNLPIKKKQAQEVENSIKDFKYTDENFAKLIHRLHERPSFQPRRGYVSYGVDLRQIEFLKVGDYIVTWNYANILKDLLDKFGDIGVESSLTIDEKSLVYFTLCSVLHSMSRTLLVDVTEDLLEDWYACLKVVKSKGFKIDFVYAHLQQVVHAYYGLQAIRAEKETATQMDQNIADMQHQVVQLRRQIEKQEADLEKIKKYREEYKKRPSFENCSDFMKECLSKASMLEWEAVGKNLI